MRGEKGATDTALGGGRQAGRNGEKKVVQWTSEGDQKEEGCLSKRGMGRFGAEQQGTREDGHNHTADQTTEKGGKMGVVCCTAHRARTVGKGHFWSPKQLGAPAAKRAKSREQERCARGRKGTTSEPR